MFGMVLFGVVAGAGFELSSFENAVCCKLVKTA